MFCTEKDKLLKAIEIMKLEKCDYGGSYGCDCKYGYEGQSKNGGEQNGCPELSNVIELLQAMTDIEYYEILGRNKNCVDGVYEQIFHTSSVQEKQDDLKSSIKNILQILLSQQEQLEDQAKRILKLEEIQGLASVGFSTFEK